MPSDRPIGLTVEMALRMVKAVDAAFDSDERLRLGTVFNPGERESKIAAIICQEGNVLFAPLLAEAVEMAIELTDNAYSDLPTVDDVLAAVAKKRAQLDAARRQG